MVADFHHGPYVRVGHDDKARKALLLVFIDHFSRDILDGRYYLHEDFAVLRFGFRRVLLVHGLFDLLYIDNGPSFQTKRFHAACKNELLDIKVVHSKPYVSEGRGVCERFNKTVKGQFESEARRYLAQSEDDSLDPDDEQATLQHALSVALRPPVRPQRALPLGGLEQPDHPSLAEALCTAAGGFSLHVARTVEAHDREGLEGLCRYGLRAPFSQRRISVLPNGKVRYELARPWPTPSGVTELIMEPL
ncbi:MAG: transposase, partial [bacterium]